MSKALNALDALHHGGVAEIKVGRKLVHKVPFERFYVVPEKLRGEMMRYWRYAWCLSATCHNANVMFTALGKERDDVKSVHDYISKKKGPWVIMVPVAVRNKANSSWDKYFWDKSQRRAQDRDGDNPTDYSPRVRKNKGVLQYLVSRQWSADSDRTIDSGPEAPRYSDLTEDLFLLGREEGPIGSPCSICPRQLQRLMKQCHFGDIDCYEYLCPSPNEDGDYKQGTDEYEAAVAEENRVVEDLGDLGEIVIESGDGETKIVNMEDI